LPANCNCPAGPKNAATRDVGDVRGGLLRYLNGPEATIYTFQVECCCADITHHRRHDSGQIEPCAHTQGPKPKICRKCRRCSDFLHSSDAGKSVTAASIDAMHGVRHLGASYG
jgi:hypothetical protein